MIEGHELQAEQVSLPELAYMMQFMLEQVINHGTGDGARAAGFMRPAAGKTGTTNDAKDAWFAGFTPNLLAVVWTGFDQKEVLGLTGAQASLPAWTNFMKSRDRVAARRSISLHRPIWSVKCRSDDRIQSHAGLSGFNCWESFQSRWQPADPFTANAAAGTVAVLGSCDA